MAGTRTDSAAFLRTSLRANAAFSMLSGGAFALAGSAVASFLGVSPPILVTGVGVNLLAFAGALLFLASRPRIAPRLALAIIAADMAWVVGTLALVLGDVFTTAGAAAALVVGNVVLLFAILQWIGVRRMTTSEATA